MDQITRVFLWTAPRSMSTAFEISISTLHGVKVFHEPYGAPYYRKPLTSIAPVPSNSYSYKEANKLVLGDYPGKTAVFVKDFPYQIEFETFLDESMKGFKHSFLIRNPQRAVLSNYRADEDIFEELYQRGEIGFMALRDFY